MLIDGTECVRKLKREVEFNERRFEEIEKQLPSCERLFDMAKNLSERRGLLLAVRILVDMMEQSEKYDS